METETEIAKKDILKKRCLLSTAVMSEQILKFDNLPHHRDWYKILDDKKYKKIVLAAPRNHSKSTCFSVNFPLNEIVRNPNIRILIVSKTLGQAQLHLREIKARIERDTNYQQYAGLLVPKYPEKWTNAEIIINRPDLSLKDATVSTVGMGGSILSRRSDLIICDDIIDKENVRTIEQRSAVRSWFDEVLMPVLDPSGRLVLIGTIWHNDDLLVNALKNPTYDYRKKYQAIVHDSERLDLWEEWFKFVLSEEKEKADKFLADNRSEMYRGVEVMWEDRISYKDLFLKRKENRVAFEKSYQNNVIAQEDQEIEEDWIKYYDGDAPEEGVIFRGTGIDLAISLKESADFTSMVSGKLRTEEGKPKLYILPFPVNERITQLQTINKAREVSLSVGNGTLSPLWVEDVGYQRSAIERMQDEGLPAKSVKVSTDKRARLREVSVYVQNGTVLFPRKGCEDLLAQLLGFGVEAHDDLVDAFVYCVRSIMTMVTRQPKLTIM